ncbi:MAG: hypothetical protein ACE141_16585 [Bryobacteraceae bacterium]
MENSILMRTLGSTALLYLVCAGISAQEAAPVSGPILGFVADASSGVRPIIGIPGAATLGSALLSTTQAENVVFSTGRDYALALLAPDRRVALFRDLRTAPSVADLPAPPGAGRLAVSPSGNAAVLYYPEAGAVAVLNGLPDSPALSWSTAAPQLTAELAALAVADGGGGILLASGQRSPVWLIRPDGGPQVLSYVAASPSLAFLPSSLDALIADGGASTVTLARDVEGSIRLTQVGGPAEGVSNPVAVVASADGRNALVANSEPAGVVTLSLGGGESSLVPCNCRVTALEPLSGGAAFRVNQPGDGPIWLLDAAVSPPRMVFVPESLAVQQGGE